ncbi:MAG: transcriptional regulator HexR [Oceanicoccus sp.]|uniref:transcriptional regulator HexR n=1 Tax=Oceanicoccus sp. TaxID=2691044 RepID=UPI002635D0A2|nr:transcriptional regulator HexR [Oceanicoccus sp.]MCP3907915.1 transcriptional regulator HexR [Oceanicoccus sp.]MDG1772901.1 transcriptional regulator HexR [Oceanicoccus sp.]
MKPLNIINAIELARSDLRKSELKVADFILGQPDKVIHLRIVDLAQKAGVSEPTVVRFCRAIGCDGFQDFKLLLAQHVAHSPSYEEFSLSEHDSAREYTIKVFDSAMDTLKKVRDSLDTRSIEAAVDVLQKARRVEFYGFGASSPVATDAQHKFFRLQIPSSAYSDPHIQAMSAMSLQPGDVVVAISQSGRTQVLLDAMALVKETGATIIGLAPSNTPVARDCDIALHIDVKEDIENYTPLPSRMAHMAVMDILAVGVSKAKGPAVGEHLQKIHRALQPLRQQ